MIKFIIFSLLCLILSVVLFSNYNSGLGGPLHSFKKKFIYSLSILAFLGFIIFGNKAYYHSDITRRKQLVKELQREYYELDLLISKESIGKCLDIQDKQLSVRCLIQKLNNGESKDYDTYVSLITNILSTFLAFIIAFTFKNKILES